MDCSPHSVLFPFIALHIYHLLVVVRLELKCTYLPLKSLPDMNIFSNAECGTFSCEMILSRTNSPITIKTIKLVSQNVYSYTKSDVSDTLKIFCFNFFKYYDMASMTSVISTIPNQICHIVDIVTYN